jgi:hypothetical protein
MPVLGKSIESLQLDFVDGAPTDLVFKGPGTINTQVRRLLVSTTADVYLTFDGIADDTCFILTPGCSNISIPNIMFTNISVMGVSGPGTLYILALRS